MSSSPQFYYLQSGQQRGPVSFEQLKGLLGAGHLRAGDQVWQQGTPSWVPAGKVPGLIDPAPAGGGAARPPGMPPPPPQAPATPRFFYREGDKNAGPVSLEQLQDLVKRHTLRPEDLVWQEGTPSWTPLRQVKGLTMAAPRPTTPPAGPPPMPPPKAAPPPGTAPPVGPPARAAAPPGPPPPPQPALKGETFAANGISFQYPPDWQVRILPAAENLANSWSLEVSNIIAVPGKDKPTAISLFLQLFPPPITAERLGEISMNSLKNSQTLKKMAFTPSSGTFGGQPAQVHDYKFGIKSGFWSTDPYSGQMFVTTLAERAVVFYWHIDDAAFAKVRPVADMVRNSFAIAPPPEDDKPRTFSGNGIEFQYPSHATISLKPLGEAETTWSLQVDTAIGFVSMQFWPPATPTSIPLGVCKQTFANIPAFEDLNYTASTTRLCGRAAEGFDLTYLEAGKPASGQVHAVALEKRTVILYWFCMNAARSMNSDMAEMIRSSMKLA